MTSNLNVFAVSGVSTEYRDLHTLQILVQPMARTEAINQDSRGEHFIAGCKDRGTRNVAAKTIRQ